jgi:hypothetical protein
MSTKTLNTEELLAKSVRNILAHGKTPVGVSLSGYDVPQSLTVARDEQAGAIRITFGYVDQEEAIELKAHEGLTVLIGKNSRKLLGFIVRRPTQFPGEIQIQLDQTVDEQIRKATKDHERMNYEVIKKVLSTELTPLLALG